MEDYIKRMRVELDVLSDRVHDLSMFITASATYEELPEADQILLQAQHSSMMSYAYILSLRLEKAK